MVASFIPLPRCDYDPTPRPAGPTACSVTLRPARRAEPHSQQPTPSRGSTKPRHATKPTKIRDVNFIVPSHGRTRATITIATVATNNSSLNFRARLMPRSKLKPHSFAGLFQTSCKRERATNYAFVRLASICSRSRRNAVANPSALKMTVGFE